MCPPPEIDNREFFSQIIRIWDPGSMVRYHRGDSRVSPCPEPSVRDFSDVLKLPNQTSSLTGSTGWLAPELIWAMVEDVYPPITTPIATFTLLEPRHGGQISLCAP